MKNVIKIGEMAEHCPTWLKDAFVHVAKNAGLKTDSLELHRHTHSEKSATGEVVGGPKLKARQSLKYVSARTQDRDDEIVIPSQINLKEFRKYAHVLVNHNYGLLPVGSDEMIEADDYGIKALTNHADTGEGTLANVIWHLVDQGHMKASSIGFVPTSFTKPGARDWDHVANQLQTNWKEFDKGRAEKSISRIITGGVLLEHSFVSVPCNSDAGMIQVMKSMDVADRVCKQLGFDPSVIIKGGSTAVPCVCDECGKEANAQPGDPCPDGKCEGSMKSKADEKAYNIRVVQKADGTVVKGEPAGEGETVGSDEGGGYASGSEDCKCSKCGVERKCEAGCDCAKEGCDGKMQAKAEKGISNKGDAPGHEFRGNQFTSGAGKSAEEAVKYSNDATGGKGQIHDQSVTAHSATQAANSNSRIAWRSGSPKDHKIAAESHQDAAEAHDIGKQMHFDARSGSTGDPANTAGRLAQSAHSESRDFHLSAAMAHEEEARGGKDSVNTIKIRRDQAMLVSKNANDASLHAQSTGTSKDHMAAARAHRDAKEVHDDVLQSGKLNGKQTVDHADQASTHMLKAQEHAHAASVARRSEAEMSEHGKLAADLTGGTHISTVGQKTEVPRTGGKTQTSVFHTIEHQEPEKAANALVDSLRGPGFDGVRSIGSVKPVGATNARVTAVADGGITHHFAFKKPAKSASGEVVTKSEDAPALEAEASEPNVSLVDAMKELLGDTFAFYKQAHMAHWNVVGPDFTEWHDLFGEIYAAAWLAIDPIAEHIRKLGETVTPFEVLNDPDQPVADPTTDARALAVDLLVSNEDLLEDIREAYNVANASGEQGLASFLADQQDEHSQWAWKLRSSLGLKGLRTKGDAPGHEFDRDYGKGFVFEPDVKVIAPAPSVKVLFVPSSGETVKTSVANIVREAMARHTGKLL